MFRFLALLSNPHDEGEQRVAARWCAAVRSAFPRWQVDTSAPGIQLTYPTERGPAGDVTRLADAAGFILGTMFPADRPSVAALLSSAGRNLIGRWWGSYLLILRDERGNCTHLLRSPVSRLPVFYAVSAGVHVVFSNVADYVELGGAPPDINWDVVRAQTVGGDYLTNETGLCQVSALEGGECLTVGGSGSSRAQYWNPCALAREGAIERWADAVRAVRESTTAVVESWASRYGSLLLELSGGLDSSIVLACLARAPSRPRITCINLFSSHCAGDERGFARAAASSAGVPLFERERESEADLSVFERHVLTARPVLNFTGPGRLRAVAEVARQCDAEVIFDGELGDQLFGYPARVEPVTDTLERQGLTPGLLMCAADLARLKRLSVWSVLRQVRRDAASRAWTWSYYHFLKQVVQRDFEASRFVTREVLEGYEAQLERFIHPWFRDRDAVPASAALLILGLIIVTSTTYHCPFEGLTLEYLSPLVSQPLVETALRIPGALNIRRGWNRAVARAAFAQELPEAVRRRTCKTSTAPWVTDAINRNRQWLRDFLLDGIVVRERILDRTRVEKALAESVAGPGSTLPELFVPLYIESWLRAWDRARARAALRLDQRA